ncbi:hypothetical protein ACLB2K_073442 [Fragaria x ananassa]
MKRRRVHDPRLRHAPPDFLRLLHRLVHHPRLRGATAAPRRIRSPPPIHMNGKIAATVQICWKVNWCYCQIWWKGVCCYCCDLFDGRKIRDLKMKVITSKNATA